MASAFIQRSFHNRDSEFVRVREIPISTGLGTWKTKPRGTAVCYNPACEHRTGKYQGKPRIGREFDYSAAQIHAKVIRGEPVFCDDNACQQEQRRRYAERRAKRLERQRHGRLDPA